MPNSRIGVEQLTIAKVLSDTAAGTTYDTPYAFAKKLMKVGVKNNGSMDPQYADDQTVDMYVEDGDIDIDIEATDCTEDEKALILGQTMASGIRTPGSPIDRPYFCVMFKAKKRNGKYKYYKFLKVLFRETDEDLEAKKEKATPQTDKITGKCIQRISDQFRKRVADADSTSYLAATGTNWFTSGDITVDITAPTLSSTLPAANATAFAVSGVYKWTFSEAILPSCVNGGNFIVFADVTGAPVAGSLSQNAAGTEITFTPGSNLAAATAYRAEVTTNVVDLSNNRLAAIDVRKFTTA